MTEYHDYHTPSKGVKDWHEPLNDNFRRLDQDIEIRDVRDNVDQYTPNDGVKFMATDTGQVYIGDGQQWRNVPVASEQLLQQGYVVGLGGDNYQTVVDPRDYADAGAAIQAANDDLIANMAGSNSFGVLYIPALDPDTAELSVSTPVQFGDGDGTVVIPRGWGFGGRASAEIQCEIDDGSMMFEVCGNKANGSTKGLQSTWFGGFAANANGNDAGFIETNYLTAFEMRDLVAVDFNTTTAPGIYLFNTRVFNSFVDHTVFISARNDCPDTNVWVFRNEYSGLDGDEPGEVVFGGGNSTYANTSYDGFNSGLRLETGADTIHWDGRIEGAGGDGNIYVDHPDAILSIGDRAEIDRTEDRDGTGTDKIWFKNGYSLYISPTAWIKSNTNSGSLVRVDDISRGYLMPLNNDLGVSNSSLALELNADSSQSNPIVVPRESLLPGKVSYPEPGWAGIRYNDGWQLCDRGTTTLSAGGDEQISQWAGRSGHTIRGPHEGAGWSVAEQQDGGHEPEFYWKFVDNNVQRELFVRDNASDSTGDITIGWQIERRPAQ